MKVDPSIIENANQWVDGSFDTSTKQQVQQWISDQSDELINRFSTPLAFGTGGIRALVGAGTSYLNTYTVRQIAKGLADAYSSRSEDKKACIAFDGRQDSKPFAREVAAVLLHEGWTVYLSSDPRPTPYLSFQCKHLNCLNGIMITASHNPKEYNGIKIYDATGGQLVSPDDQVVIEAIGEVQALDTIAYADLTDHPNLILLSDDEDEAYLSAIKNDLSSLVPAKRNPISIVYSNLNGCGITLMKPHLDSLGFDKVLFVKEQQEIDPNFSGTESANPEDRLALEKGIDILLSKDADLFIANDPDADRISLVLNDEGKAWALSGHELAVLLADFLIENKLQFQMQKKPTIVKSLVTTYLIDCLAKDHDLDVVNVLPGFKYISEWINKSLDNSQNFLLGAEESYGYMLGTNTQDKDGIAIGGLICLMVEHAKLQGSSLKKRLYDVYKKYGVFREKLISVQGSSDSPRAMRQFKLILDQMRSKVPNYIRLQDEPIAVERFTDYLNQTVYDLRSQTRYSLDTPKSNIIKIEFSNNVSVYIRPSGTEPKVKIYGQVVDSTALIIEDGINHCDMLLDRILEAYKALFTTSQNSSKNQSDKV